ncbi:hypothetical protein V8E55_009529 [Tylopilus felleus]
MGLDANMMISALDNLPAALTNLFGTLSKKTRWKFSCVIAGPDPRRDWDITMMSVHLGQTPMGFDFATFQTNIEKPLMSVYAEFADLVFLEDKRKPGVNTKKEEVDNNNASNASTQAPSDS